MNSRRLFAVAVAVTSLALSALATPPTSAASPTPTDGGYTSSITRTEHVTTRYGNRVTIELELPAIDGRAAPGRFPVVACLCYITEVDTEGLSLPNGQMSDFVRAGYVAATVRVSGSGTSEGGPWNLADPKWQRENYDAIEWLGTQPWSTGKVGTVGESGNGMSQIFTSQLRPPHLTTMIVTASGADSYDTLMPGGMVSLQIAAFACGIPGAATNLLNGLPVPVLNNSRPAVSVDEVKYLLEANAKKVRRGNNLKPFCPLTQGWYQHRTRDSFWRGGPLAKVDKVTIPVWAWSGWDDIFNRAIPNLYGTVGSQQKMLAMGLNSHEAPGGSFLVPDPAGGDGFDQHKQAIEWFDHFLKGKQNGIVERVRSGRFEYYLNGAWTWQSAPTYPIPGTDYTNYYLDGDAGISRRSGAVSVGKAPTEDGSDTYLYTLADGLKQFATGPTELTDNLVNPVDPNNATNDNAVFNNLTNGDQRLGLGSDTVSYLTPPLTRDVEVTGPISATLFAKTSSADTDFVFRIADVFPDSPAKEAQPGFWKFVTSGNLRGQFRSSFTGYQKLTPIPKGAVVRYDIEGYPTSYLFKKGHRIAFTIRSSNAPRLMPNTHPAKVTIMHGPSYPSSVKLPVIPAGLTTPIEVD